MYLGRRKRPVLRRVRPFVRWASRIGPAAVAVLALPVTILSQPSAPWPPATLRETGLYSDWDTRTVADENLPFSPQYPLWTDGAKKSRWLYIPEGQSIDGSDPDLWTFPVGTRVWKEFRFDRRAETRYIERTPDGWQFASYVWNESETEAVLVGERGIKYSVPIRDGVRHAIPSRSDCRACHEAGPVRLLGVTALQLTPDRDPNAPHAEPAGAHGMDLNTLVARGLLRGLPARLLETPPRIVARSPTERAALGYLHANCGNCHTGAGELSSLAFALNYTLNRGDDEPPPAIQTALGRPSRFVVPGAAGVSDRVLGGDPERSVLVARMSTRNPIVQMPPLGTRIVDDDAVQLIRRWIAEDTRPSRPGQHPGGQRR